jgi:glyoxylase-like metal-dependent hydrolase (beta-lactamase superfamily II)
MGFFNSAIAQPQSWCVRSDGASFCWALAALPVHPIVLASPSMETIGNYKICSVVTGWLGLDGGAMFGVVPKVLWSQGTEVDDQNRIRLSMRSLVAVSEIEHRVVIVDTGAGTKWSEEEAGRYTIDVDPNAIDGALERFGKSRDDVTDVVATHFHFDHNGGISEWAGDPGGATTIVYPNAMHWVHQDHWDSMLKPNDKEKASFLARDYDVLKDTDRLMLVGGDQPLESPPGVEWFVSNGHTTGQLLPVFVDSDHDLELMFVGDAIPTVAHLRVPWVMAYDLYPLTTIAEKKAIYDRVRGRNTHLAFPHDPKVGGARLDLSASRPIVAAALDLS